MKQWLLLLILIGRKTNLSFACLSEVLHCTYNASPAYLGKCVILDKKLDYQGIKQGSSFFTEQQAVMRLIRTLASDPIRDGTIDPRYTGQQHPDRYILGKYKAHQSLPSGLHLNVKNHFPKKSHFKAHPAWLQSWWRIFFLQSFNLC